MPQRKWSSWPRLFGKALTETGGVVGLVGVAVSAVGATVAAPVVLTIGGATVAGALLYAGYRGIPPQLLNPADFVGTQVSIAQLVDFSGKILKLGIVGYTQSGKTTFLAQALHRDAPKVRTNRITATLLTLQTTPALFVALLDGDGEQFSHQFEIAENSDFLLIFVDHSRGDHGIANLGERTAEHDRFLEQLEYHLRKRGRIGHVHLVLNKRDLWESSEGAAELQLWLKNHVRQWERSNVACKVTSEIHSNWLSSDIGRLMQLISEAASSK